MAVALSSASRSRSSRGCRPIDPTGAANISTCWCLLAAVRQPSVTWSGWCACHQATGLPPLVPGWSTAWSWPIASRTDQPCSTAGADASSVTGMKPCSISSGRKSSPAPVVPGRAMGEVGSTTRAGCSSPAIRMSPLVTPSTACSGEAFCGAAGAGSERAWSALMDRTAPWSCSSVTLTTCEGRQPAWAKASTAVSSPMNRTVLVRSCSQSPGVRQDVQS